MVYIRPEIGRIGQERAILEVGDIYTDPLLAFKEYVTNGVDAIYRRMREEKGFSGGVLDIKIDPSNGRVVVSEDGIGMPVDRVRALPASIFAGDKLGRPDERGEKGIGLLSFISMGGRNRGTNVDIISRVARQGNYGHLNYSVKDGRLYPDFSTLTEGDVEKLFFGGFEQGTRVVLNLNRAIFNDHFKNPVDIRKFLRDTYNPLLINNNVLVCLEDMASGKGSQPLEHGRYPGEPIIGDRGKTYQYEAIADLGEGGKGTEIFRFHALLFADPDSRTRKIGLYAKDVRVYDSIARLLERDPAVAALPLWSSGYISGFINNLNLGLVLGRDGIRRGTQPYKMLVKKLQEMNDMLWPNIESLVSRRVSEQQNKALMDAWNEFRQNYKGTTPIDVIRRSREGISNNPKKPKTPQSPEKDEGDGGRRVPFNVPVLEDFGLTGDEELRSRAKVISGDRLIAVNSGHRDYKRFVVNGDLEERQRYLVHVLASEAAVIEVETALTRGSLRGSSSEISRRALHRMQDLAFFQDSNGKKRK